MLGYSADEMKKIPFLDLQPKTELAKSKAAIRTNPKPVPCASKPSSRGRRIHPGRGNQLEHRQHQKKASCRAS